MYLTPLQPRHHAPTADNIQCQWQIDDPAATATKPTTSSTKSQTPSTTTAGEKLRVSFLTEQTSHHPPVSAYYAECPEKGIVARGFDQLSAKFTGTSIRVIPGIYNEGIFVTLQKRDNETYHLTHPAAYLGGFLRGLFFPRTHPRHPAH